MRMRACVTGWKAGPGLWQVVEIRLRFLSDCCRWRFSGLLSAQRWKFRCGFELTARAFNALNRSSRSCALLEAPSLFEACGFSDSSPELLDFEASASSFVVFVASFAGTGSASTDDILMTVNLCYWIRGVLLADINEDVKFVLRKP